MKRSIGKMLAVFLTIIMLLQILPMSVMAEEYGEYTADKRYIDNLLCDPAEPSKETSADIAYEDTDKRDEFSKTYVNTDGTYTKIVSETPVHFLSGSRWLDIDNSIENKNGSYTNKANSYSVSLPQSLASGYVCLEKDGKSLSFSLNDLSAANIKVENNTAESETGKEEFDNEIANNESKVRYTDSANNTEVEYIVLSDSVKENIIVKDRNKVKETYSFNIETNGLSYVLNNDSSLGFYDNNELKFEIPKPVMTDSGFSFSYDISVSVSDNADGSITLTYAPSPDWINSDDRVYPINIDPAIVMPDNTTSWVEDTWVEYDANNSSAANRNGYSDGLGLISDTQDIKAEVYTKINTSAFSYLNEDAVLINATYMIGGGMTTQGHLFLKELNESCNLQTVTYNTKPALKSNIADYYTSPVVPGVNPDAAMFHFDITNLFNGWLKGETNNGFAVTAEEDVYAIAILNGSTTIFNSTSYSNTVMVLDYVYTKGYDDSFSYHSQDAGRAGTGYVNDCTGSVSFIRNDISIDGNIMPVSIWSIYNGEDPVDNQYGVNWQNSYHRKICRINDRVVSYLDENGSSVDFVIKTENNEIKFEALHDDKGYELKIPEIPQNYQGNYIDLAELTRPDGYVERFNAYGYLISVTNPDYPGQHIDLSYETVNGTPRIDYITDGVNRKFDYVYNNDGLLAEINCLSSNNAQIYIGTGNDQTALKISYTYTDGYLTAVTFSDGESIHYTYDNDGKLLSAKNIDNYKISYTYVNGKVSTVSESTINPADSNTVSGGSLTYTYLNNSQTRISDAGSNSEVYQFDHNGRLLNVFDNKGQKVLSEGSSSNSDYYIIPSIKGFNSTNLLKNGDFESTTGWPVNANISQYSFNGALSGDKVLKVENNTNNTVSSFSQQEVTVSQAGKYTFSAYVYSSNSGYTDHELTLKIIAYDSNNSQISNESVTAGNINNSWQRYTVTADVSSAVNKIKVFIGFNNSKGLFYVDNAQLEYLNTASAYNLIKNGSFNDGDNNWTVSDNSSSVISSQIIDRNTKALKINGGFDSINTVYQTISVNGSKGDVYSAGAWFKGNYIKSEMPNTLVKAFMEQDGGDYSNYTGDRYAQLEISYQYEEEDENNAIQTLSDTVVIPFSEYISDWQMGKDSFALKGDTDAITLVFRYAKNTGDALITDIQLNNDNQAFSLDNICERIRTSNTNQIDALCPCENCEELNCTCDCADEEHCNCIWCKRRSSITVKDSFGNVTSDTAFDGIYSVITSDTFTSDGNYISSSTDADGNTVSYGYNTLNGILESITDGNSNTINYGYDSYGLLKSVYTLNAQNQHENETGYTYTKDRLTAVTHNGFSYNFSYDIWGQLKTVSVGSQTIVTYDYGTGAYRDRLNTVTYHNAANAGTVYGYYYDGDNVSSIEVNNVEKFTFSYDNAGELTQINALDSRTVRYTEGRTDICDFNNNLIYSSYVNDDGDFTEVIGGLDYVTKDYDSDYDISTGETTDKSDYLVSDGRSIGNIRVSDWFGRTKSETVKTESATDNDSTNSFAAVTTNYGYPAYTGDKTSERVEYMTNRVSYGTDTSNQTKFCGFAYTYDSNGNITAEYRRLTSGSNTLLRSYVYDELNQLIRVNVVGGYTYVYDYDEAGNLLSETTYAYTAGNDPLPAANEGVISYTYDSVWGDKLTSVGNTSFTYDLIGNPVSIGSDTLTWEGRNLSSYTKGNERYDFSYDENGLRHKKTVTQNNAVTGVYDYVWSNGKLISQKYTDNTTNTSYSAKYIYSSEGYVQGFIYNDATYLYVRNLMGDIVAIVDEQGREVMTISYDVWGDPQFTVGSLNNDNLFRIVRTISAFTYRGYCYDGDMELYYLQSRYYSPEARRFINTDDTQIAISTQGDIIGANLFAYCENNPVNAVDYTGYWDANVHNGFYDKKGKNRIDFNGAKDIFVSYDKKRNTKFGTYYWARICHFNNSQAQTIATACASVDSNYSPFKKETQGWHFNINAKTANKVDSRVIIFTLKIAEAFEFFESALKCTNKKRQAMTKKGLEALGESLHPIQDMYAHTDDKVYFDVFNLWSHAINTDTDNPFKRPNQLKMTAEKTISILHKVYYEYEELF